MFKIFVVSIAIFSLILGSSYAQNFTSSKISDNKVKLKLINKSSSQLHYESSNLNSTKLKVYPTNEIVTYEIGNKCDFTKTITTKFNICSFKLKLKCLYVGEYGTGDSYLKIENAQATCNGDLKISGDHTKKIATFTISNDKE